MSFPPCQSHVIEWTLHLTTEYIVLRDKQLSRPGTMLTVDVLCILSPHSKDKTRRLACNDCAEIRQYKSMVSQDITTVMKTKMTQARKNNKTCKVLTRSTTSHQEDWALRLGFEMDNLTVVIQLRWVGELDRAIEYRYSSLKDIILTVLWVLEWRVGPWIHHDHRAASSRLQNWAHRTSKECIDVDHRMQDGNASTCHWDFPLLIGQHIQLHCSLGTLGGF